MQPVACIVEFTDNLYSYLTGLEYAFHEHLKLSMTTPPFDQHYWQQLEQVQDELLQMHLSEATQLLDTIYGSISELSQQLSPEESMACRTYHRARIEPFFFQVPFVRRAFDRPLGYAGDYMANEMLFENKPAGLSPLARLLSHYALNNGPARAHRARLPWVHRHLRQQISAQPSRLVKVCSFSCGPEYILRQFIASGGHCEITLCDHDSRALDYCRRECQKALRKAGTDLPLHYVELSANALLKDPATLKRLQQPIADDLYDVMLVPGLLDYLQAPALTKFLDSLTALLRPGGLILLTNVNVNNPWRSFMEYIGDWYVISRTKEEFQVLAEGTPARLSTLELITDASGTNLYYAGQKI